MKFVLIRQPAGLGDILFSLKIALKINEKYNPDQIIWPVCDQYIDACKYIDVPNNFIFVNENDAFLGKDLFNSTTKEIIKTDEYIYIPLQHACEAIRNGDYIQNLYAKYEFVGLQYNDWAEYVKINRNTQKEDELYNNIIKTDEPYILVNRNYGTLSQKRQDMHIASDLRVVEFDYVLDYNLFDWIKIILNAKEVHTIQTSLAYLLDALKLQNVHIYHRAVSYQSIKNTCWDTFEYCNKLHNPNWKYE